MQVHDSLIGKVSNFFYTLHFIFIIKLKQLFICKRNKTFESSLNLNVYNTNYRKSIITFSDAAFPFHIKDRLKKTPVL